MAKTSSRKLFLFGRYSIALLLPKKWLVEHNVKIGDIIDLELDNKKERIIVKLNSSAPAKAKIKKKSSRQAGENDKTDWEPIPQM